ncbi:hypothetical protein [Allobranchiibius huperziae]|uniref:Uncharacterized protein n=1 Tax=Allobranchiibius huperziae TaxID=1874116 RepID=A0A853DI83_9MICO|nr:hypothetical protein [Allobranchiibius huperziae]NYJ76478.1 hypothetical protein [Allobranchiibius huperziae]
MRDDTRFGRGDADQIRLSVLAIIAAVCTIVLLFQPGSDLAVAVAVSVGVVAAALAVALMVRRQRDPGERP